MAPRVGANGYVQRPTPLLPLEGGVTPPSSPFPLAPRLCQGRGGGGALHLPRPPPSLPLTDAATRLPPVGAPLVAIAAVWARVRLLAASRVAGCARAAGGRWHPLRGRLPGRGRPPTRRGDAVGGVSCRARACLLKGGRKRSA